MEIVGLQWNLNWEDKRANFVRVKELAAAASPRPGALLVLPEMFATGFSMNVAEIGEDVAGETFAFLASLAREHSVFVLGGIAIRDQTGRGFNEAVVVDPDGNEAARYRKMHPFRFAGEGDFYDAGASPVVWKWGDLMVAPFICYDLRFPEIYRLAAQAGAELFVTIANWPSTRVAHWRLLLQARAVENQAYSIGVNRSGTDPNVEYPGASLAVDPSGDVVAELDGREQWFKVEIDPEVVRANRRKFPFLEDLRGDLFRA